jgi:hypothetical protein
MPDSTKAKPYGWELKMTPKAGGAAVTRGLKTTGTGKLEPIESLAKLKTFVNEIIYSGMKIKKDIKTGFDLADLNADNALSREEDIAANMLANKFNHLDTYTPKAKLTAAISKTNTPDNVKDAKLDRWELNANTPMWQINTLLKTYGNGGTYLDLLMYA